MRKIIEFMRNETGAELAEYAVGVALLVAIAVVIYQTLGDGIANRNSGTAAQVENAATTPFTP